MVEMGYLLPPDGSSFTRDPASAADQWAAHAKTLAAERDALKEELSAADSIARLREARVRALEEALIEWKQFSAVMVATPGGWLEEMKAKTHELIKDGAP